MDRVDEVSHILHKLEAKYNEEFSLDTICDGQAGSPYITILVHCKTGPEGEILARISQNEKGEWILQDNYVSYCMLKGVREEIAAAAEKVYGDCKVYNKPASMVLPESYTREMSTKEFLSRKDSLINIYIYLPPQEAVCEKETKAEELRRLLSEKGYQLKGLICYTVREDFYHTISESSCRKAYMEKREISATGIFLLENEKEYAYLRWS